MPKKNPGAKPLQMILLSLSGETKLPKEMYRILETLCKDKWTPLRLGENGGNPNRW